MVPRRKLIRKYSEQKFLEIIHDNLDFNGTSEVRNRLRSLSAEAKAMAPGGVV